MAKRTKHDQAIRDSFKKAAEAVSAQEARLRDLQRAVTGMSQASTSRTILGTKSPASASAGTHSGGSWSDPNIFDARSPAVPAKGPVAVKGLELRLLPLSHYVSAKDYAKHDGYPFIEWDDVDESERTKWITASVAWSIAIAAVPGLEETVEHLWPVPESHLKMASTMANHVSNYVLLWSTSMRSGLKTALDDSQHAVESWATKVLYVGERQDWYDLGEVEAALDSELFGHSRATCYMVKRVLDGKTVNGVLVEPDQLSDITSKMNRLGKNARDVSKVLASMKPKPLSWTWDREDSIMGQRHAMYRHEAQANYRLKGSR